jgi:hypothetical protein
MRSRDVSLSLLRFNRLGRPYIPAGFARTRANNSALVKLVWIDLNKICGDETSLGYREYGARGAILSPEWRSFKTFMRDLGPIPNGVVLGLEPGETRFALGTCKWINAEETLDANNSRSYDSTNQRGDELG